MSSVLYMASFESSNFSFDAFGETREEALAALKAGLRVHGLRCGIPSHWWEEYADDIVVREVRTGHAYRDGCTTLYPNEKGTST
jgi:hypothetical protein